MKLQEVIEMERLAVAATNVVIAARQSGQPDLSSAPERVANLAWERLLTWVESHYEEG